MSEPLVEVTTPSSATPAFLLDGEAPRLGGSSQVQTTAPVAPNPDSTALAAPSLAEPAVQTPRSPGPSPVLSAPGAAPVLGSPDVPPLPSLPSSTAAGPVAATAPTLHTDVPAVHTAPGAIESANPAAPVPTAAPTHPMAHLMPQKTGSSEASKRAAEIRAAKKSKARKIKIGVAVVAIVVGAIVGPPLARWFIDAINDAGNTSTEVEG